MRRIFYGWWVVLACCLIYVYISGLVYSFTAFFEPISRDFGWTYTQISFSASIRGFEMGIFAPLMGFLVDRFGSRKLLFGGAFALGLGLILFSLTNSLTLFYGASIVFALGLSASTATVMVPAVANWFKKDVGKALGVISAGHGVGGLLVPLTVEIINRYNWRTTFLIFGVGVWLFVLPLVFIVRRRSEHPGTPPDGKQPLADAASDEPEDRTVPLREALGNRLFWHISLAEAIRLMTNTALITHIIPYLSSLGITRPRAAFAATLIIILSIPARLVAGWMGDIFKKNHVLAVLYLLGGLSLLAFAYAQTGWGAIVFIILFPLSWGASPLRGAIMREYFGVGSLGSILGIMAGIGTLARVSGPLLAGRTYDMLGYYRPIWYFFAGTFILSVWLMLKIPARPKGVNAAVDRSGTKRL